MFFDTSYLIFVLPTLILAMWAQAKVSSTYAKYGKIRSMRGVTGAQVAEMILRQNGVHNVTIERVAGNLTDHFDPRTNVIRLSETVYGSASVAALGVAAHETGHALQHNQGYVPIKMRNAVLPVANLGSQAAFPLVLLGLLFNSGIMIDIGIILFGAVVLFQLFTLPVEFDASHRAISVLDSEAILEDEELKGAKKVLTAAAMTYVAAAASAIGNLLRLLYLSGRRRD
ncbi:MAG: zinc metallopeptidase [Clostridia bacterium]|nr:zinc metallopeptidase [Clostridia bacterium]